eukprot:5983104-Alexandrium_andersonii.AAC.1
MSRNSGRSVSRSAGSCRRKSSNRFEWISLFGWPFALRTGVVATAGGGVAPSPAGSVHAAAAGRSLLPRSILFFCALSGCGDSVGSHVCEQVTQ